MIFVTSSFSKSSVFKMFTVHRTQSRRFHVPHLRNSFEKLRFHDGLVWTVGLTGEIELRFQVSPTGPEW